MKAEELCHSRKKGKSESRYKFQSANVSCLSNLLSKNLFSLSTDSDIKAYSNLGKYVMKAIIHHSVEVNMMCQGSAKHIRLISKG